MLVPGERFGSVSADDLESSFRSNAAGPLLLTQMLAPLLAKGTRAKVANVSSVMGSIHAVREFRSPSYAMSKAALNSGALSLGPKARTGSCAQQLDKALLLFRDPVNTRSPLFLAHSPRPSLRVDRTTSLRLTHHRIRHIPHRPHCPPLPLVALSLSVRRLTPSIEGRSL